MAILVRPLPGVGAEVEGVDLASAPSPGDAKRLESAFAAHGLLFFRDQYLSEQSHIDFAQRWGGININRFFAAHPDHPEIALVLK